jgi:hypothetical protein
MRIFRWCAGNGRNHHHVGGRVRRGLTTVARTRAWRVWQHEKGAVTLAGFAEHGPRVTIHKPCSEISGQFQGLNRDGKRKVANESLIIPLASPEYSSDLRL